MNKLKIISYITIILLLSIALIPSYNAFHLKKEHIEKEHHFYLEEYNDEALKKSDISLKPQRKEFSGRVYGYTVSSYCWSWNPKPFVRVKAGFKTTRSLCNGYYSISCLPLNVPIKISASKVGYYTDRKTILLTDDEPSKYLILDIQPISIVTKEEHSNFLENLFSSTFFCTNTWTDFFGPFSFVS